MWNAWGISWGDSWGTSWGPLHQVEEFPGQVYGNGRRVPGYVDLLHGDDDLVRIVRDKWEAIEAAQARDEHQTQLATKPTGTAAAPNESHGTDEGQPQDERGPGAVIALAMPIPPAKKSVWHPGATHTLRLADVMARKAARSQAREEEAIILALFELL